MWQTTADHPRFVFADLLAGMNQGFNVFFSYAYTVFMLYGASCKTQRMKCFLAFEKAKKIE